MLSGILLQIPAELEEIRGTVPAPEPPPEVMAQFHRMERVLLVLRRYCKVPGVLHVGRRTSPVDCRCCPSMGGNSGKAATWVEKGASERRHCSHKKAHPPSQLCCQLGVPPFSMQQGVW